MDSSFKAAFSAPSPNPKPLKGFFTIVAIGYAAQVTSLYSLCRTRPPCIGCIQWRPGGVLWLCDRAAIVKTPQVFYITALLILIFFCCILAFILFLNLNLNCWGCPLLGRECIIVVFFFLLFAFIHSLGWFSYLFQARSCGVFFFVCVKRQECIFLFLRILIPQHSDLHLVNSGYCVQHFYTNNSSNNMDLLWR